MGHVPEDIIVKISRVEYIYIYSSTLDIFTMTIFRYMTVRSH